MANKVSLMLCMLFLLEFVIFCGDIIGYQLAISRAYAVTSYVNTYISEKGVIDDEIQEYVQNAIGSDINYDSSLVFNSGNHIDYSIEVSYQPLLGIIKETAGETILTQRVYIK